MEHLVIPSDIYYGKYNKEFNTVATRGDKSIQVKKLNDSRSEQVSSIIIRNIDQLVDYEWDSFSGKYLSVIFTDGTVRINDMSQNGKLVAFLRTKLNNIDSALWDRVWLTDKDYDSSSSRKQSFNFDILEQMPQLIKYVGEKSTPNMVPFTPQAVVWRQQKEKITDIHLLHQSITDSFVIVINGEYTLNLPNNTPNKLIKLHKKQKGLYIGYYENGFVKEVDIRKLLENESSVMTLLESYTLIKDYFKYVGNHISLMMDEMIRPLLTSLSELRPPEDLHQTIDEILEDLLYEGDGNTDDAAEWIIDTFDTDYFDNLQTLIHKAYNITMQILIMCIIPVLERIIILANKIQSILLSLQLLDQGTIPYINDISISQMKQIINLCQKLLKKTIENIQILRQEQLFIETFMIWVYDFVSYDGEIDDDIYVLEHDDVIKYGHTISEGINILFKRHKDYDILRSHDYLHSIKECEGQLKQINDLYFQEKLTNSVEIGPFIPLFNHLYDPVSIILEDVITRNIGKHSQMTIYIVKLLDHDSIHKFILGIVDPEDKYIKKNIEIPYETERNILGVKIIPQWAEEHHINKISFVTRYHANGDDKDCFITTTCSLLKQPTSPLRRGPSLSNKPVTSITSMELAFNEKEINLPV